MDHALRATQEAARRWRSRTKAVAKQDVDIPARRPSAGGSFRPWLSTPSKSALASARRCRSRASRRPIPRWTRAAEAADGHGSAIPVLFRLAPHRWRRRVLDLQPVRRPPLVLPQATYRSVQIYEGTTWTRLRSGTLACLPVIWLPRRSNARARPPEQFNLIHVMSGVRRRH